MLKAIWHGVGNGIIFAAVVVVAWMVVLPVLTHYGVITLPLVMK